MTNCKVCLWGLLLWLTPVLRRHPAHSRWTVLFAAADSADSISSAATEAVAGARVAKRRRAREPRNTYSPPDVSNDVCWVGDFSKDTCCRADSTTPSDCWDDLYSFEECCPNADCWDGEDFTYAACCDTKYGPTGNVGCWSGDYTYEHCCLANRSSQSWVEIFVREIDTEQFYGMDDFYTDAQYGSDFGYYSTGRVLGKADGKSTHEFAHYTTYPMALSPHFGRVFCRLVFIMWIRTHERAPFRVVEMGAGSGQLGFDITQCVKKNELGIQPAVWRRFASAFEYVIMERSPALAERQRERGLRVVPGDAQTSKSCQPVLAALATSDACGGEEGRAQAPECQVGDRGTSFTGASVVLNNELLDAFAPVKLQLSLYGHPVVTECRSWQEMRVVHIIPETALTAITHALRHSPQRIEAMLVDLRGYTSEVFCRVTNSSVGQAAMKCAPTSSCLAMVFALSELMGHHDLQLPAAAHNMRLRLYKDRDLCARLQDTVAKLEVTFTDSVVLPRQVYRMLRHQLREVPDWEVEFLGKTHTRQVPAPLSESRCNNLQWWFNVHEARITRLVDLYRPLGYPNIQLLVRPGERNFVDLVDCLMSTSGGFMLAVDYGASFEALAHSMSVEVGSDGVFIPPVPQELMQGLPDCYAYWPLCAGRVDWTTFVDFTNVAAAGEQLGWRTLFYGPQSLLEHLGRRNMTVNNHLYDIPGYAVLANSWASRYVQNWYGHESLASKDQSAGWQQRWTSFKWLLLEKPLDVPPPHPEVITFPSWHLDSEQADPCWSFDPSAVPLADWISRHESEPRDALSELSDEINENLGKQYSQEYEQAQLAVRIVDWFVATEGCDNFRPTAAKRLLNSQGLWLTLRTRLFNAWQDVWDTDSVERVALAVLRRIAEPTPDGDQATPVECAGFQTYIGLCEGLGGGMRARARVGARVA